jgi:ABC-type transport system substrate-binding protein
VRTRTAPRPEVAQLTLRSPDELVRKAIAAGIDRKALTAAGTQGAKHPHRADSLVAVPALSDELGMPPDAPGARPHPGRAPELLRADGYRRTPTGGWAKDGNPLHVIVGAVGEEPYGAVATELVAELNAAGLPARLRTSRATPLYGSSAAAQAVDVLVGPRPVGGDPASDLASELGCPSATAPSGSTPPSPNAARFCDPELQPLIERALAGQIPVQQALDTLAPQVWSQAVIVPLFQPTDVLAVGDTIRGVAGQEGPTAVFAGVRNWSRTGK